MFLILDLAFQRWLCPLEIEIITGEVPEEATETTEEVALERTLEELAAIVAAVTPQEIEALVTKTAGMGTLTGPAVEAEAESDEEMSVEMAIGSTTEVGEAAEAANTRIVMVLIVMTIEALEILAIDMSNFDRKR